MKIIRVERIRKIRGRPIGNEILVALGHPILITTDDGHQWKQFVPYFNAKPNFRVGGEVIMGNLINRGRGNSGLQVFNTYIHPIGHPTDRAILMYKHVTEPETTETSVAV